MSDQTVKPEDPQFPWEVPIDPRFVHPIVLDNFVFLRKEFHSAGLVLYDRRPEKERKENPHPQGSMKGDLWLDISLQAPKTHTSTQQSAGISVTTTQSETLRKVTIKGVDRRDTLRLYASMVFQLSGRSVDGIKSGLLSRLCKLYKISEGEQA